MSTLPNHRPLWTMAGWSALVAGVVLFGLHADRYSAALATRVLVVGLLAASVAVLAGWCGLASLGQTFPFALGAFTTGLLAKQGLTTGPLLVCLAAGAGVLGAAVTGPIVLRVRGTVFLMVTLALGELAGATATRWSTVTGGSDGLFGIPATRWWPGTAPLVDPVATFGYAAVVVGLVVVLAVTLLRSPYGLLLRGVRDNEPRLRAAGHPVERYLYAVFVGAGAVAAVAGSLLVTAQRYVSPADLSFDLGALVLLAVVIGGTASIAGAFAGAALLVLARDWLAGPWPGHAPLLVGALLVLAVYALPEGLSGAARRLLGGGS